MTLYEEIVALGIEHDSHASDLYLPANEQTRELVRKHGVSASQFIDQITHTIWLDVPFSYDPFYNKSVVK